MIKKLKRIINTYGVNNQLRKFNEETFELQEAIIKRETEYSFCETSISMEKENLNHITEEIADVMVMLEQFKIYYNINDMDIEKIMDKKINRQIDRIEERG